MAIRLVVSDTVPVRVSGVLTDAQGRPDPFSFTLQCRRLDTEQFKALFERLAADGGAYDDRVIEEVAQGWSGVLDADGSEVAFSDEALRQLMRIPGVASLAAKTYATEIQARSKN